MEYKFEEDVLLREIKDYVDSTYTQHYASNGRIQVTEFIMSQLDTPDFLRGCVLKYVARYGHKDGHNRKDLMKAMHYLLLMLCFHDRKFAVENEVKYASSEPSSVMTQNVYVQMTGGRIGQEQNGTVVEVGYGELDERGLLVPGTFRYSTEG